MQDYKEILKSVGYPTDILVVDFESYFDADYNFEKLSTIEYIMDPRFELTGLGVGNDTGERKFYPDNLLDSLPLFDWEDITVLCQNARFDITILQTKFGIVPKYIIDVKDLAKHYDAQMSAKLADLAKTFGLQPKGRVEDFKGLHYTDMTKEQRQVLADYCLNDVDLETELFKILLPKLSNPEVELKLMRHTLDLWLHKSFDFDRDLADSLKVQMRCHIKEAVDKVGHMPEELRSQKFIKYLQIALPPGEQVQYKEGKRGNIAALAKNDDFAQSLLAHTKPEVRDLMLARQAVKSWPLHIKRITNMENQATVNGGKLRIPLNYYAAHTGRWGGGEDINLHNFGGRGRAGTGIDPLISKMRELLRAPEGYTLGIGDSAQIEARILAWLAGQQDLVGGFANGEDIYSEFATTLFRIPIRKERKTDPAPVARMLTIKRGFGKDAILGCGYGMGADKFYQRCLQNSSLRPYFDSGQYTYAFIKKLIDTYRTKYSKIPEYWRKVENAFKQTLKYPHLKPKIGPLEFSCVGHEVSIKLPSGRVLYYRHCSVNPKGELKYRWGHLWGGSITENVVQSVARDLLSFWVLLCEQNQLSVVLHVHDEIICLIKKDADEPPPNNIDIYLDKLEHILCSLPGWAVGLPVGTEVKESEVYCK